MLEQIFSKFASTVARWSGNPASFILALTIVAVWAISGPIFHFSDTWQLVINTGTTIVTFLMVFLIQNSQNRDSTAMQLKLDEIIRAHQGAANRMLDIEELSYDDLQFIRNSYERLAKRARLREQECKKTDTDVVELELEEKESAEKQIQERDRKKAS